jgi:hypothetical protein
MELPVRDLEVRDPPIEELIGRLFSQGSLEPPPSPEPRLEPQSLDCQPPERQP